MDNSGGGGFPLSSLQKFHDPQNVFQYSIVAEQCLNVQTAVTYFVYTVSTKKRPKCFCNNSYKT